MQSQGRWLQDGLRDKLKSRTAQMMKRLTPIVSFALLAMLAVAAHGQDKRTGTIKGKVRVEKGSPVGVAVVLRQGDREVTRVATDRKGYFTIARVQPGVYGLTFRKAGLQVSSIEKLEVTAGKTRTLKDLILGIDLNHILRVFVRRHHAARPFGLRSVLRARQNWEQQTSGSHDNDWPKPLKTIAGKH